MRRQRPAVHAAGKLAADETNSLLAPVIGIDLGDLRHAVCVIDREGNTLEECKITNTRDSFTKLANLTLFDFLR